jgi:ring-1,2-phenylacetyl-CoA epoxidase subunit PaaE
MANHFYTIKVKSIKTETADCISVLFDIPGTLKDDFTFDAGQNITIKTKINGQDVRRTYSICSSPFDNEVRIAIKKAEGGLFSNHIHSNLKQGDELQLMPPTGKFISKPDKKNKKNYLAFAAGSGITPVIAIIKATLQTEPLSAFTLIYGSRSRSTIIFFEDLQALKNVYINQFTLINILSAEKTDATLNYGRINKEKLIE